MSSQATTTTTSDENVLTLEVSEDATLVSALTAPTLLLYPESGSKAVQRLDPVREPANNSSGGSSSDHDSSKKQLSHHSRERRRLQTQSSPFCGRRRERQELRDAYRRVATTTASEVVVVHGSSGTGKSALVEELRHYVVEEEDHSGFFVGGKYDQLGGRSEPYSAIVAAFTDLCDLWMMQVKDEQADFAQRLYQHLGSEVHVLTKLISNLAFLLPNHPTSNNEDLPPKEEREEDDDHFITMSQAFVRFKQLCKYFLRAAAAPEHPTLLFLDDLHWADDQSLEVIQALIQDRVSKNILLVLCYRDDDVGGASLTNLLVPKQPTQATKKKKKQETRLHTMEISLGCLDLEGVNDVVQGLIPGKEPAATMQLSEVLLGKTGGNVYFVLQLLESLVDQGLLFFRPDGRGWDWDVDQIQSETNVADNIVDVVMRRLRTLSLQAIDVLKFAAAMGYHFDVGALLAVVVELNESQSRQPRDMIDALHELDVSEPSDKDHKMLEKVLDKAVEKMLIERTSVEGRYKFSHDRMQQCLYEMVSPEEQDFVHFLIGSVVWKSILRTPGQAESRLYFLAAEHMNRAKVRIEDERTKLALANLNRQAGKLAANKSAFLPGIEYIQEGISLLDPEVRWDPANYDLSLDLHSTLAELENSLGRFTESEAVAQHVLQNAVSLRDKLRGYRALVVAKGGQARYMESVAVGIDVLRQLGEPFPRHATLVHVGVELAKTMVAVAQKSEEELLNLPRMTNRDKIAAMNMLGRLSLHTYLHLKAKNVFAMVGMRMVRLSCRYGSTNMTPFALSHYATIQALLGRHDLANRYAKVAIKLIDRLKARDTEARTITLLHHFVVHWREPWQVSLPAFGRGYTIGLETGDLEFAFASLIGHLSFMIYAAKSLEIVAMDALEAIKLLEDFNHKTANIVVKAICQWALNMIDCSGNPLLLTGDVVTEEELEESLRMENNHILTQTVSLLKMQLAYFLESAPRLKVLIRKCDRIILEIRGHFGQYVNLFSIGMSYFALYRTYGRRRFRRRALTISRAMKRWVGEGCTNALPFHHLLRGERLSLGPDKAAALAAYKCAVDVAVENKSVLFEAMSYERAATGLADSMPDLSHRYMAKAVNLWHSFSAREKVLQLENKYPHLLGC